MVVSVQRVTVVAVGSLLLVPLPSLLGAASLDPNASVRREVVRLPVEEAAGLTFHHLSTTDGLSQSRVDAIVQDDLGLVWFGTQYGINRYDGYSFKVFVHEPGNERSGAGTYVRSLFKDRQGLIWVGWNNGIDRLDPRTEIFTHYRVEPEPGSQRPNAVLHISQDHDGMLWLATGSGLHRLDPATGTVTHFRACDMPGCMPTNDVNWCGEDSHGRFWVGTSSGLVEFDRTHGRVLRLIGLPDPFRTELFEDREGRFWIVQGSGIGLTLFDPKTNTLTPYSFYRGDPKPGALTGVFGITEDADGRLWLASMGIGLLSLNRERNHVQHYGHRPQDLHSIAENSVAALFQDRDGNLWTGLHSAGVAFFAKGSQPFEVFRHVPGDPNSLTLDFVDSILEAQDGVLWIGNDDGLNRIDRSTGKRQLIDLGLGVKPMVISLAQDHEGALWVGTLAQGVTRYDPRTRHFETYRHDPSDAHSLSRDEVHRVYVGHAGAVWIATDDGVDRFDPVTRKFTVYRLTGESRQSQSYRGMAEDATGKLWLSSTYSGLHRLDPISGQITAYLQTSGDSGGLRDTTVHDVLMSPSGTLWIGTQNGLNSLDTKTGTIRGYGVHEGMAANAVSCLLEDDRGNIWLSTTRGISKYTPGSGTFSNYSQFAGLPGSDFTGWDACSKGPRGELYFAGFSGAVAFAPTGLEEDTRAIPIVLTDLAVDGIEARIGSGQPLERAITYSRRVTLQPGQRDFSIRFAGLQYSSPETLRYRYRLDGLEDARWQESPSSIRQATYTTVPAGDYSFDVQVATERGTWQTPGVSLKVRILPPWWATWSVRTGVALMLGAAAWLIVRARVRHVAREVTLQMEARSEERMRIARDLHDTLLQGLLSASMQLSVVQDHVESSAKAKPLLEHVANLLRQLVEEGRSAVRGLRTWHLETDDLERAIAAIPGDLQIHSAATFGVVVEGEARPLVSAARTEVYLIAREAISNALRHSDARAIDVTLTYVPAGFGITIRDDGRGFVAASEAPTGTHHFGLKVMTERAERLGGDLKVSSGYGVGTEIVLWVPGQAVYLSEMQRSAESPYG